MSSCRNNSERSDRTFWWPSPTNELFQQPQAALRKGLVADERPGVARRERTALAAASHQPALHARAHDPQRTWYVFVAVRRRGDQVARTQQRVHARAVATEQSSSLSHAERQVRVIGEQIDLTVQPGRRPYDLRRTTGQLLGCDRRTRPPRGSRSSRVQRC
jgi:hypothetical protein